MPIDDALGKIEDKNTKTEISADKIIQAPAYANKGLISKAQELLGKFLTDEYFRFNSSKNLNDFLETLGPFVFRIFPSKTNQNWNGTISKNQECAFVDKIDKETWNACIKNLENGYLEQTDLLAKEDEINIKEEGIKYFPEFKAVEQIFTTLKKERVYNPYVLAMGMTPKYRPLIAIAIEKSYKKQQIELDNDREDKKNLLLKSVPTLKNLAEAANEYQVNNLKEIIIDLNKIVDEYNRVW